MVGVWMARWTLQGIWLCLWLCFIVVKGLKENSSEGKDPWGKVLGNWAQTSTSPLPAESHWICPVPPAISCDNTCEMSSTGKAITDLVPGFSSGAVHIGAQSYMCPSTYQNPRLLEGKQVFIIHYVVCTNHEHVLKAQ